MLVITFRNISALAPVSNYDYEVWVTKVNGDKHVITSGVLRAHRRSDGWQELVGKMLEKEAPEVDGKYEDAVRYLTRLARLRRRGRK